MRPAALIADGETPSRLSALQTIAKTRRDGLAMRLLFAAVAAGVLTVLGEPLTAVAVWLLVVVATQTACLIAFGRFEDADDLRPPTRIELAACHTTLFVAGLWCSGIAAPLWFEGGVPGKLFALMWVYGAFLHATLHMPHDRRLLATVLTANAVVLIGLPAIELALGHELRRLEAGVVLFGALMLVGQLIISYSRNGAVSAMLRAERERALEAKGAAEAASESKGRVLAAVRCEVRPLKGVQGLARQLLDTDLTSAQRRQAEALEDVSRMLLSRLEDILDYSKIEAGAIELDDVDVDVRRLADRKSVV